MKIIDLLNKIANDEEVPKKIRIDHWCYNFEWIEHESNYYDRNAEIDLMSCLSMDKEELNYKVHEINEEKKIPEKLFFTHISNYNDQSVVNNNFNNYFKKTQETINQLIDYLKSKGE